MFKRKKILVYPRLQILLVIVNAALAVCAFGFSMYEAFVTLSRFRKMGEIIHLDADHPYFQLIDFQAHSLYVNLIFAFFVSLIVSALVTLMISHRLSGPIVRLKSYFRRISETQRVEEALKFRKGDFFEDLPGVVNDALSALNKK